MHQPCTSSVPACLRFNALKLKCQINKADAVRYSPRCMWLEVINCGQFDVTLPAYLAVSRKSLHRDHPHVRVLKWFIPGKSRTPDGGQSYRTMWKLRDTLRKRAAGFTDNLFPITVSRGLRHCLAPLKDSTRYRIVSACIRYYESFLFAS